MKTVTMTVWHGNYRNTESRTAKSVREALIELLKTPMGIGYGPKAGSEQFNTLEAALETTGQHQHGWGDYTAKDATSQETEPKRRPHETRGSAASNACFGAL